jgi:hypothetical protein
MAKIQVHNVKTGEVIEREMNAEELAQLAVDDAAAQARAEVEAQAIAAKATAEAKLKALGLTTDDLKALGL